MQVIISIPSHIYKTLIETGKYGYYKFDSKNAIKNGIPLPKGHGDLKDQKDLAKSLYDYQWIDQPTYMEVTNRLINTPTIIEADKE